MQVNLEQSWKKVLAEEFTKAYFSSLVSFVKSEYQNHLIFPPGRAIFHALELAPFDDVKVIILGQDPYHTPGAAMGLAFSVPITNQKTQPSLANIFKELSSDLNTPLRKNTDLSDWASQGVLLLNATLTVRQGEAGSHQGKGWETFTDSIIQKLSEQKQNLVFLLWGKYAQAKAELIDESKHLVLKAAHPSPFSAAHGFFGCKHFSKTNEYLSAHNLEPINWN